MYLIYVALRRIKELTARITSIETSVGSLTINNLTGNFIGSGSPEGVQVASPGARYYDSTNNVEYVKITGTETDTGWF